MPIDPETAWRQVQNRDGEGAFFYAVATTGVFCRPDCKSRQPLMRENVRFFATAEAGASLRGVSRLQAVQAGRPDSVSGSSLDKVRAPTLKEHLDRAVPPVEPGSRGRAEPVHGAEAVQAEAGREPSAIPEGIAGGEPA